MLRFTPQPLQYKCRTAPLSSAALGSSDLPARTDNDDQWAILAGLRFGLAFIVMCCHLQGYDSHIAFSVLGNGNGLAAVLGFFVVSGYSIAHSLERDPDPRQFYKRRLWRLYPVYLIGLLLAEIPAILFGTVFKGAPHPVLDAPTAAQFVQAALFLQGFTMPGALPGNIVVWSLSIEVGLYLISPLLPKLPVKIFGGLIVASALINAAHHAFFINDYDQDLYGFALLSLAWPFLIGFALCRFRSEINPKRMILIAAVSLVAAYPDFRQNAAQCYGPEVFASALIGVYLCRSCKLPKRISKSLLTLGDLSYCLYLTHFPLLWIMGGFNCKNGFLLVAANLAAATAVLYYIDYPVRAYRQSLQGGSQAAARALQLTRS